MPEAFVDEGDAAGGNILQKMVNKLLNSTNEMVSDKDTKLDVLSILSNVAMLQTGGSREVVRSVLLSVSEWFDDYLLNEEGCDRYDEDNNEVSPSPTQHCLLSSLLTIVPSSRPFLSG